MNSRRLSQTVLTLALCAGLTAASGAAWAERHGNGDARDTRPAQSHHDRGNASRNDQHGGGQWADRHNEQWNGGQRDRRTGDGHSGQWSQQGRDDRYDNNQWRGGDRRNDGRYDRRDDRPTSWQGQDSDRYRGQGDRRWGQGQNWQQHGNDDRYRQGYQYRDRYAYSAPTYRYSYGGRYYETGDYGARLLRNALSFGYQQGVLAARAARSYNSPYDYRGCDAYRDGSYGYEDGYIDEGQYSYYYRQGFERGYNEAYYGRYHYGAYRNGGVEVVVDLLDLILDLRHLH